MAKKVLSIALALLMVVNVFAVAVSATVWTTENAVITLTTDDTKPQPGDTVNVTVSLQNNYNVHALQIMLAYDKNYYEVVGTTDEIFTNLLADETAKFTGVAQALLAADAQEDMYAGLYSSAQKAQYGLARIGFVWLASLGAEATPVFTETTALASIKLKVKADAPTDGKGVIMVDPTFVVETGVDTPAFDTRSATYVGKGAATVAGSATSGKLYGLPINVDGAKFEGCVHVAGEAVKENEVAADCTTAGSYDTVVYCSLCNEEISRDTTTVPALGHTEGEAVKENEVAATPTVDGSYDMVVYCTVCNAEISRETTVVPATGHEAGEAVEENRVEATCTENGSYDSVVYCTCCEPAEEISRETVVIPALGHTEGEAVVENNVAPTCTEEGSYDTVVYCSVCGAEISRASTAVEALGHTAGEAVKENEVAATPTVDGSYESVVYCTVCNAEISRETVVIPALGHEYGEAVEENRVEATCTEDGSYDVVVYCTCCDPAVELSRETVAIPALGHTDGEAVVENNVAPTCTEEGSYDTVVYCTVCNAEVSRETTTVEALGHTPVVDEAVAADCVNTGLTEGSHCSVCGEVLVAQEVVPALGHVEAEAVEENRVEATMDDNGSYDMVVYCSVCGAELSRETFVIPSLGAGPADYEALNALVEKAEALDRTAFTDDSLAAVDAVLAKITDDMKLPQQDIVDGWADELADALAALEYDVEKAEATVQTILSKATVAKDDVITVTVKMTANYPVGNFQLPIIFDKTEFEVVGTVTNKNYYTVSDESAFASRNYIFGGNANKVAGFAQTSDDATWDTADAKAKYGYAYITATYDASIGNDDTTYAIPQGETLVTFELKALKAVEDTTNSVFISPDWTKTSDNKSGLFTIGFSTTEEYVPGADLVAYGMTYNVETIAIAGVNVTGTVTSFDDKVDNSDVVTIEFFAEGSDEAVYTATATGSGAQEYALEAVQAGTYTVKVSKANHATRTYEVVVGEEDIAQDMKIHLLGDINGDGKANTVDAARANAHAKGTTQLTGYDFDCANVSGDAKVNTVDVARINAHAKGTTSLWK